jgi:hypothetical protein
MGCNLNYTPTILGEVEMLHLGVFEKEKKVEYH